MQDVKQWSRPWVLKPSVQDPENPVWQYPQESELLVKPPGVPESAPWSRALVQQQDLFATPRLPAPAPTWASLAMGFYSGAPYMTPGATPGVGGSWRALQSGFPPYAPPDSACRELTQLCEYSAHTAQAQDFCPRARVACAKLR